MTNEELKAIAMVKQLDDADIMTKKFEVLTLVEPFTQSGKSIFLKKGE